MQLKSRFLKSVIATAKSHQTKLPWGRGKGRPAKVIRRVAERG
ncbi:hypothetical protein [Ruegeria sp. HKCCD8929]|nr:hypothetical protein [Ruegeria sp. HKCCD8929]